MTPINTKAADELREEIESLLNDKPETGEAWAEICALEALAVELEKSALPGFGEVADGFCKKLFG